MVQWCVLAFYSRFTHKMKRSSDERKFSDFDALFFPDPVHFRLQFEEGIHLVATERCPVWLGQSVG